MVRPSAQWRLDNQHEIEALLAEYVVTTERSGDSLLITGINGMEVELKPGDCLITENGRLGVLPVPNSERPEAKQQTIDAFCEQCDKPIKVQISVLQDPNTINVVCSEECKLAYEFMLRMNGGKRPLSS